MPVYASRLNTDPVCMQNTIKHFHLRTIWRTLDSSMVVSPPVH